MSELGTLARPYAKAAFEYASAANGLQSWDDMLRTAALVVSDGKIADLLSSPSYTAAQQVEQIAEVLGDSIDDRLRNFLTALARNRRLSMLPKIHELFRAMKDVHERKIEVELVAADELTPEQQQGLAAVLSRRLEREVVLTTSIDKALIGGVVIRAGDMVFDASLRGRLGKLAKALNS